MNASIFLLLNGGGEAFTCWIIGLSVFVGLRGVGFGEWISQPIGTFCFFPVSHYDEVPRPFGGVFQCVCLHLRRTGAASGGVGLLHVGGDSVW